MVSMKSLMTHSKKNIYNKKALQLNVVSITALPTSNISKGTFFGFFPLSP
jgi:hypothetical protein